jgi:hypothetical protein
LHPLSTQLPFSSILGMGDNSGLVVKGVDQAGKRGRQHHARMASVAAALRQPHPSPSQTAAAATQGGDQGMRGGGARPLRQPPAAPRASAAGSAAPRARAAASIASRSSAAAARCATAAAAAGAACTVDSRAASRVSRSLKPGHQPRRSALAAWATASSASSHAANSCRRAGSSRERTRKRRSPGPTFSGGAGLRCSTTCQQRRQ